MKYGTFLKSICLASTMALLGIGCSGSSDDTTSSTATELGIAGSLGNSSSSAGFSKIGALALSDYTVRCVTLTGDPKAGVGTVSSTGSFSLTISGVSASDNVPVGCFILAASDSSVVATLSIDSGTESMSGSNSQTGSINAGGGETINFGSITFDPDKGTATVSASNIVRAGTQRTTSGTFADPTGDWALTCITADGYDCPSDVQAGMTVRLNQMTVTDDQNVKHTGLSIWESTTAFNACGQTESLNTKLPTGWTSDDANLAGAFDSSFLNLPAASTVAAQDFGNGKTFCDATFVANMTCDQITNGGTAEGTNNADGWGNGNGSYSDADCQAMCQANGLHDLTGATCQARFEVDHSFTSTSSPGDIATEIGTYNSTTGKTTNSFIVREVDPEKRFVIGELTVDGKIGTTLDKRDFTTHFCQDNGDGSGCTSRKCIIKETQRITMTQSSASAAVVEVVMARKLDTDNSDAQCSQDVPGNYVKDEINSSEKFLMTAVKQ